RPRRGGNGPSRLGWPESPGWAESPSCDSSVSPAGDFAAAGAPSRAGGGPDTGSWGTGPGGVASCGAAPAVAGSGGSGGDDCVMTGNGAPAGARRKGPSQVAAFLLFPLDRLEQGLEVALAEPQRSMPLDQLEEDRGPVLHRLGEDLQQVPVLVPVDQDAPLLQLPDRYAHGAD